MISKRFLNRLYLISKQFVIENRDTGTNKAKKILASIKNTMSDRHIVEKNFNDLLDTYRANILPDVVEGWCGLSPTERASFSKMNNFFCGLHFLVALTDVSSETLRQWESLHSEDASASESGTIRLIRTACKAIQKQCSEQAGCHIMFRAYLHTQGVSLFPIAKFKGNRFNIVLQCWWSAFSPSSPTPLFGECLPHP